MMAPAGSKPPSPMPATWNPGRIEPAAATRRTRSLSARARAANLSTGAAPIRRDRALAGRPGRLLRRQSLRNPPGTGGAASMSPTPSHPEAPCGTCPTSAPALTAANSFAMMFGEHAPSTAVIEFATGSPFGMQMLGRAAAVRSPWLESGRWLRRRAGGAGLAFGPQLRRQRGRGAGTTARRAGAWSCLDRSGRDGIRISLA